MKHTIRFITGDANIPDACWGSAPIPIPQLGTIVELRTRDGSPTITFKVIDIDSAYYYSSNKATSELTQIDTKVYLKRSL